MSNRKKSNPRSLKTGFTLMEMLIVVVIIAVLVAVAIPTFTSSLERSREATDLANVRSAYGKVSLAALLDGSSTTETVSLTQKQDGWQTPGTINIGGITEDSPRWIGTPKAGGSCKVFYTDKGVTLDWGGGAATYPFNTEIKDFFGSVLYEAEFWTDRTMVKNPNFEFDSRCPDSVYIKDIQNVLGKSGKDNSLLSQPDCTWAFLGNGGDGKESERYLYWTSLNTNNVGANVQIPVIVQTGDGKFYVSETTTGQRTKNTNPNKGAKYVAVSIHLEKKDYKDVLNAGQEYDSLEKAYDAYQKVLELPKYADAVKNSQSSTP